MRIIFMGTPEFAVPGLQKLINAGHMIAAAVTQPDRPRGRSGKPAPSAVKECAAQNGLGLILQPEKIRDAGFQEQISGLKPDLIVVIAYGKILPPEILKIPKYGCINVHASLLPEYRGAWPIAAAIMDGMKETGVTTMLMDEGIDTGDIFLQAKVCIDDDMTFGQLNDELSQAGADLLIDTIRGLEGKSLKPAVQDNNAATYTRMINRIDERVDWTKNATGIHNHIRAMDPEPGAYTTYEGKEVKLYGSSGVRARDPEIMAVPGEILSIGPEGATTACGDGILRMSELHFSGAKRMSAEQYFRGRRIRVGGVFE